MTTAKMTAIQQLAKMAEIARRGGGSVEADYRNGAQEGTLTQIMWGRVPSRATTIREITCLDNGNERCYDKTYELDVTTLTIVTPDGQRCSLREGFFWSSHIDYSKAMPLEPGTRLGHYDVTALLGEGGMGQVW